MTDQERVDKLKARMSRWQEYVDKPQAKTLQQTRDASETQDEGHQSRIVRKADGPPPDFQMEMAWSLTLRREDLRGPAPASDPKTDIQEARIAELKSVLAREQEQADRLAEEVRRAQTLHAATIHAHLAEEKIRHAEPRPLQRQVPEEARTYFDDTRRKTLAVIIGLLLVITSGGMVAFFITR